jgi:hypothetical protein
LGEEVNDDLQGVKEVIRKGSRSRGKRMTNKSEKAYLVLLLFMLIFSSQLEDLGGGMGAKRYQCQPALEPARLALEFQQNSDSTLAYCQRQKEDESSKELGTMQDNNDNMHSNYSPMSNKGRDIILILVLKDLHCTTI